MTKFARLDRLPPYVFATVNGIKMEARRAGQDIIDLGMGNPDLGTPEHIVDKLTVMTMCASLSLKIRCVLIKQSVGLGKLCNQHLVR